MRLSFLLFILLTLCPIEYIDHQLDQIPEYNVLEAAFVVRDDFKEEVEFRVLIHLNGTSAYDQLYGKEGWKGPIVERVNSYTNSLTGGKNNGKAVVLPINPNVLIEEVVINPNASITFRGQVKSVLGDLSHLLK